VETQFRSSAPACDKSNFQKSGIRSKTGVARRAEGPAHPEYDRKCCDRNKPERRGLWWTEAGRRTVVRDGSAPLRNRPCDGSSASAGSCLPRKETSAQQMRATSATTSGGSRRRNTETMSVVCGGMGVGWRIRRRSRSRESGEHFSTSKGNVHCRGDSQLNAGLVRGTNIPVRRALKLWRLLPAIRPVWYSP
jgi:hypothetical protein